METLANMKKKSGANKDGLVDKKKNKEKKIAEPVNSLETLTNVRKKTKNRYEAWQR